MLPIPLRTRTYPALLVVLAVLAVPAAAAAAAPPPLEIAYICDLQQHVTTIRALQGPTVLAEISVPGCEPAGRAMDGSALVSAAAFARLRDRLFTLGHEPAARQVARPLGSFAALPAELLPAGLLAAAKEGITVEWCGTVVSKDRDDCLGTCSCGNKDGCPCRATKTTSPKSDLETQTN